mgnify:CR=1 FL=1
MYAKVIVGLHQPESNQMFDYRIPAEMAVEIGVRVIVPFGRRNKKTEGYVISLSEKTEVPADKIKEISEVLDEGRPTFTPPLLELAEWMQERYFCTLRQCLQAIMPTGIRTKSSWTVRRRTAAAETKLTPKETAVLELFGERACVPLEEIQAEFGEKSMEFLRKMEEKGLIALQQQLRRREYKKEKRLYALDLHHPLLETIWKRAEREKRLEGQRLLLEYLGNGTEATAAELKERLGITDSPIQTLRKKGLLKERRQAERRQVLDADAVERTQAFTPTAEQAAALSALRQELTKERKRPVLLHGVTGSGKTEIYMQLIAEVLAKGQQAIVLVPEIALTPLIAERFLSRFGEAVSVTHSRLSAGERLDQWRRARDGEISVVIGPRSALFLPFPNVGAILMDESHENSYVSDSTPRYDTKEVAAELAKRYGALFLMGTATPDVISYYKAKQGEYLLLELKERTGGGVLPQVFVTDMRKELAEGNRSAFGRELQAAIRSGLEKGEQTMLFLNRRGYATFVSCRSCGHVMTCPTCDITYTYHAKEKALVCHYCGRKAPLPQACPVCSSKYIRYFGTGTQKIEEEAKRLFPHARILRMDLDTTLTKHSHEQILTAFAEGKADILIGTQMIAKGHDYPNVTLVGIMAADISLNADSFTAAETGFRLMLQAAGRAGRRDDRGRVFIQTYQPQQYAVQYAAKQDYQGFYEEEMLVRQMMGYPPFSAFFRILITGEEKAAVEQAAQELAERLARADGEGFAAILGPVPAALPRFRGAYRYQIIIKAAQEEPLRQLVLPTVAGMKKEKKDGVRFHPALNTD